MVNNDKPGTHRELKPTPLISLTHKWLLIVYSSTYKIYQLGKNRGFSGIKYMFQIYMRLIDQSKRYNFLIMAAIQFQGVIGN